MIQSDINGLTEEIFASEPFYIKSPSKIFSSILALGFLYNRTLTIDGHGHSDYSDGIFTISNLAETTSVFKDSMIFLTDHNTIQHFAAIPKIIFSKKYLTSIPVIVPGIEITCQFNGQRCHTIWLGGKCDQELIGFMVKQRSLYIDRETERLKKISNHTHLRLDRKDYLSFCGTKTPNWTITFNYLLKIGIPTEDARQLMRTTKETGADNIWWETIPSLSDVYHLAQKQGALLFLSHIADVLEKSDSAILSEQLENLPHLYIDLSERDQHLPIKPALGKIPVAYSRAQDQPCLVGTDYHTVNPKPLKIGSKLRFALAQTLLKSANCEFNSASALISHPGVYASFFGGDTLIKHSDLFHRTKTDSLVNWIETQLSSPLMATSNLAEKLIGMATFQNIQSNIILQSIAQVSRGEGTDLSMSRNLMEITKKFECRTPSNTTDIISLLALGNIHLRLGQYALHSKLLNGFTNSYPTNFIRGYNSAINSQKAQLLMQSLWVLYAEREDKYYRTTRLIWRLKSACSALSTVTKNFFDLGNSRHDISHESCLSNAIDLLKGEHISENICKKAYHDLIYDHLAATLIIKDSDIEYNEILATIILPPNWEIIASEYVPRKSYHHRLWLLIRCPLNQNESFTFELMVKKETDFNIGRAYQWYEKSCALALTSSPWRPDGSFDRDLALAKWSEMNSIIKLLTSEIKEWNNYGEKTTAYYQ